LRPFYADRYWSAKSLSGAAGVAETTAPDLDKPSAETHPLWQFRAAYCAYPTPLLTKEI
jgi:hypothetical protein